MSAGAGEPKKRRIIPFIVIGGIGLLILSLLGYAHLFGPADPYAKTGEFVVEPDTPITDVGRALKEAGYIRSEFAFDAAFISAMNGRTVRPGGYQVSGSMDIWTIVDTLARPPTFAWIKITPGMRKEQIAEILTEQLGWSDEEKQSWLTIYTAPSTSFTEGVYYPDTYLIRADQTPKEVAERIRSRFQEVFAPYANEAIQQGKDWTDVLTLASLVEKEAAKNDKELVAAILWNRIDRNMLLQVDATLQYIKGNEETGWWPVPKSEDKYIVSPFNTYKNVGLPPHPIANPSLDSIRAVLNPDATDCLYYLHDNNGQIHCSVSYKGQVQNVDRYLR